RHAPRQQPHPTPPGNRAQRGAEVQADAGQGAPPGQQAGERPRQQGGDGRGGQRQQQRLQRREPGQLGAGPAACPQQPVLARAFGAEQSGHQEQGAAGEEGELESDDQEGGAGHQQRPLGPVQDGGQGAGGLGGAAQGRLLAQGGGAVPHGGAQGVDPAGADRGEVRRRQPGRLPGADPVAGEDGRVGEQGAVRREVDLDGAAAAQVVQLPVGGGGVHRPVHAGDPHVDRRSAEAVGQAQPRAGFQAEPAGGGLGQGGLDGRAGRRRGGRRGHPAPGDPDPGRFQGGEVREVGLPGARRAAVGLLGRGVASVGGARGAGQRVRAGAGQGAEGDREPVQGRAGAFADDGVGGGALVRGYRGPDDERGAGGVARVPQGVPQGRVADRPGVGGEGRQDGRGEQDRQQGGGQQGPVSPCAGENEPCEPPGAPHP